MLSLRRLAYAIYITLRKAATAAGLLGLARRLAGPATGRLLFRLSPGGARPAQLHGHKMYLASPGSYPPVDMAMDRYEPGTTRLFEQVLKPGMVVIDVGAHVGYYTLLAAKRVGSTGRVYAFEPDQDNHALLVKNIDLNGYNNVVAVKLAVSDRVGCSAFYRTALDSGRHSMYHHGLPERGSVLIETTTVDAFLGSRGWPKVDLVKIDVEGAELDVLNGMGQTLARSGELKLIIEFNPSLLRNAGANPAQLLNRLAGEGFKVYCIDDRQGLIPVETIDVDPLVQKLSASEGSVNLFFRKE